jgi:hypothetical protein
MVLLLLLNAFLQARVVIGHTFLKVKKGYVFARIR